jgi:hypothetical protein
MKMKTVNYPRIRGLLNKFNFQSADAIRLRWKDIEAVFKCFDKQLADHGLEVVMYDTGLRHKDDYIWRIAKKR